MVGLTGGNTSVAGEGEADVVDDLELQQGLKEAGKAAIIAASEM